MSQGVWGFEAGVFCTGAADGGGGELNIGTSGRLLEGCGFEGTSTGVIFGGVARSNGWGAGGTPEYEPEKELFELPPLKELFGVGAGWPAGTPGVGGVPASREFKSGWALSGLF